MSFSFVCATLPLVPETVCDELSSGPFFLGVETREEFSEPVVAEEGADDDFFFGFFGFFGTATFVKDVSFEKKVLVLR